MGRKHEELFPVHLLDKDAGIFKKSFEIFWMIIAVFGNSILAIINWIYWELGIESKVR